MFVAITHSLKNQVRNQIRKLRSTERGAEKCPEPPVLDGTEPWGAPSLWGPVYAGISDELRLVLTCERAKTINFKINVGEMLDDDGDPRATITLAVKSPGVPRLHYADENGGQNYSTPEINVRQDMHPGFAAYAAYVASCAEIDTRWQKVEKDIIEFLDASKSLNEALKLWPDVARYIDQELIDKVNEKIVKREKPAQSEAMQRLAKMDMGAIAQSTVLARLISSDKE